MGYGGGAGLLSIGSAEENEFITSLTMPNEAGIRFWIGLERDEDGKKKGFPLLM